jgi:hypothetical protein
LVLPNPYSGNLEPNVEPRGVAVAILDGLQGQLVSAVPVYAVAAVSQSALSLVGVRLLGVDLVGKGIIEVKLGREVTRILGRTGGTDLEVNVDRPPLVPAGKYCGKLGPTAGISQLIPPQELLPGGIETRS